MRCFLVACKHFLYARYALIHTREGEQGKVPTGEQQGLGIYVGPDHLVQRKPVQIGQRTQKRGAAAAWVVQDACAASTLTCPDLQAPLKNFTGKPDGKGSTPREAVKNSSAGEIRVILTLLGETIRHGRLPIAMKD